MKKSPGVFLETPDDFSTIDMGLIQYELDSIKAVCDGDRDKAMMAAGECAQRINDMPKVGEMVQKIVKEAEEVLGEVQKKYLG